MREKIPLLTSSPAVNASTSSDTLTMELENCPRDALPDIGAREFWQPATRVYLLLVVRR